MIGYLHLALIKIALYIYSSKYKKYKMFYNMIWETFISFKFHSLGPDPSNWVISVTSMNQGNVNCSVMLETEREKEDIYLCLCITTPSLVSTWTRI